MKSDEIQFVQSKIWELEMCTNRMDPLFKLVVERAGKRKQLRFETALLAIACAFSAYMGAPQIAFVDEPALIWGAVIQPSGTGKVIAGSFHEALYSKELIMTN